MAGNAPNHIPGQRNTEAYVKAVQAELDRMEIEAKAGNYARGTAKPIGNPTPIAPIPPPETGNGGKAKKPEKGTKFTL